MKTKISFFSVWGISVVLSFSSCAGEGELDDAFEGSKVEINSAAEVAFGGNETSASFNITASDEWSLSGSHDWFNLSSTQGRGSSTVTISTVDSENPSGLESRRAILLLTSDNRTREIAVVQSPATKKVSIVQDSLRFMRDKSSNEMTFDVLSNADWTLSSSADWFEIASEALSGVGNASVTVKVGDIMTESDNVAMLTITSGNQSDNIVIFQQGILTSLAISSEKLTCSASSGNSKLTLAGDASWVAVTDADWLSLNQTSGKGDFVLTLSYGENNSPFSRVANITVTTKDKSLISQLVQSGAVEPIVKVSSVVPDKYSATVDCTIDCDITVTEYGLEYYKDGEKTPHQLTVGYDDMTRFSSIIPDLTSMTKYFVRAYAKNAVGVGYSDYVEFVTTGGRPGEDDEDVPVIK